MVFVLYIIMLIGIARASGMLEHPESLADILAHTHAAGFLVDTHGEEHTDEIGMHTVLYSLQRSPYRDAPALPCPSHRDVRRPPSPPSQPAHRRPPSLPTPSTPTHLRGLRTESEWPGAPKAAGPQGGCEEGMQP